jgi:hypothetical protein
MRFSELHRNIKQNNHTHKKIKTAKKMPLNKKSAK